MSRSSPSSESLVTQLRQQLILDQVLIMELQDQREEIAPQLKQTAQLLAEAQTLVESKVDEASHLAKIRQDLQQQYEHLQHVQHLTNTALEETRRKLATENERSEKLLKEADHWQNQVRQLQSEGEKNHQTIAALQSELTSDREQISRHIARIGQLDAERHEMKNSRSWRWTTWLRAIERRFK